jgi:hypothetical protein
LTNAPITARLHNNDGRMIARSALRTAQPTVRPPALVASISIN